MNVALLAPSYSSVHGNVLENIKQQISRRLVDKQNPPLEGKVIVLDQSFWNQKLSPSTVINKLFRANIAGIFILIRYGQAVRMRVQLDEVMANLFSVDQCLPLLPICVFFHGSRPIPLRDKQKFRAMFKTYLAEQVDIPPGLFTQKLLQLRHCYSEFLREDKIADIMKWLLGQMKLCATYSWRLYAANYDTEESQARLHGTCDPSSAHLPPRDALKRRRSLSEPKVIPNLKGYVSIVCEEARRVSNNDFSTTIRKAALRQLLNNDKQWTDHCNDFNKAEHIHGIFSILTTSRDRVYEALSSRISTLKALRGSFRPRKHELFLTNFSWAVQAWSERASHAIMRCKIGSLGHMKILRFDTHLDARDLRLLRSHILDYYANFDKPMENRAEDVSQESLFQANLRRSHSLHDFRSFIK